MKKSTINNKLIYLFGIILFIVLWQIIATIIGQEELIFPGPFKTIKSVLILLKSTYTYKCIFNSLFKMLIGFFIALCLAIIFGSISGNSSFLEKLFVPSMTAIKAIPTACLVFLFIVLSGAKNAPIYIVIVVSFPILYEGVKGGIKGIDENIIDASLLDGSNGLKSLLHIKLPLALPYIFVSIASSLSLSFKIEIMAEVITGSSNLGLGSAIVTIQRLDPTDLTNIFAYGLISIVISLILELAVVFIKKSIQK